VAYREGLSPLQVAMDQFEDAQARQVQAEIAFQNALVGVRMVEIEIEHARHALGHRLEIERAKWATVRAAAIELGEDVPEIETEEISQAREAVRAHESRLVSAREALRVAAEQRSEAAKATQQAREELERVL
jgi:hypothetical protein